MDGGALIDWYYEGLHKKKQPLRLLVNMFIFFVIFVFLVVYLLTRSAEKIGDEVYHGYPLFIAGMLFANKNKSAADITMVALYLFHRGQSISQIPAIRHLEDRSGEIFLQPARGSIPARPVRERISVPGSRTSSGDGVFQVSRESGCSASNQGV